MITSLFLIAGFVCLVLLLFTNRLVLFGILSVASFMGYFLSVDNGSWLSFILFLFGILLLLSEVFIPGFGLIGILGGVMLGFGYFTNQADLWGSIMDLSLALIVAVITAYVLLKRGYRFLPGKKLVLGSALDRESGYSTGKDYQEYLSRKGTAITTLRPAGKIKVDGRILDVVSDGRVIPEGAEVEVVHVEGIKITVREL